MTLRTAVVVVGMSLAAASLAACGGDDGDGSMRATLTEEGCTYDGDVTPAAGMFTVEVENETSYFGAFALTALADGASVDTLESFVDEAQRQFDETGELPEPPGYYTQVVRVGVDAGESTLLPADVDAGTYVLTCFVDDLPVWRGYVAAQLDVTE